MLPFVLVAITTVGLIAFAFTAEALQGVRGQRGASHGGDAASAADAALTQALASYAIDSLWQAPLGIVRARTVVANGLPVSVEWQRQQPLVVSLRAKVRTLGGQRMDVAERDHYRAVWLAPPRVPIVAALASNGTVVGRDGTLVSGSDVALPGSPCGTVRDTMSVGGIAAPAVQAEAPGLWAGAPTATPPPSDLLRDFQQALGVIAARTPVVTWRTSGQPFPMLPDWSALQLHGDTVAIGGPTRWVGLVAVRGRLVLTGRVQVTGLLLVDGSLDARNAELLVQGAVIAADTSATGVMLGAQSRLFYDRCAVEMGLATVARPSLAPFSLWHSLPR